MVLLIGALLFSCAGKKKVKVEPPRVEKPEPKVEEPVVEPKKEEKEPLELQRIHFEFDKYRITDEARKALVNNAEQLMERKNVKVKIEGHCDERGSNEYNINLGQNRAKAVKDFLTNYGISADRLKTASYGEERPLCEQSTEECWSKNRRAEFVIMDEGD